MVSNFYSKASGLDQRLKLGMLEAQRIYFPRHCGASVADPLLPFMDTSRYNWRTYVVPGSGDDNFGARKQFEDQISVKPGSFLLSLTAVSNGGQAGTGIAPDDFEYMIEDKASQEKLSNSFLRYESMTPTLACLANNGAFAGRTLPLVLPVPWLVRKPGLILVKITNMSSSANNINMALTFAEPVD